MIQNYKKVIFTTFSIISLLGYGYFAFATISPGDTLDPVTDNPADCPNGPTDPTCIVTLSGATPTNGLSTIGSDIGLGGTLTEDTTINLDENDFTIAQDNLIMNISLDDWSGFGIPGAGFSFIDTDATAGMFLMGDNGEIFPYLFHTFDDGIENYESQFSLGVNKQVILRYDEQVDGFDYRSDINLSQLEVGISYTSNSPDALSSFLVMDQAGARLESDLLPGTESSIRVGDHFSGVINGALLTHTAAVDSAFVYAADVAGSTQTGMTYIGSTGFGHSLVANSTGAYFSYTDFTDIETDKQITINEDGFLYSFDTGDLVNGYYQFPNSQGLASQVLTTDGAGNLSWGSSAGLSPISIGTSGTTLYSSGLAGTGEGDIVDGGNIFLGVDAGSGANNVVYSNFFGNGAGFGATDASVSNFFGHSAGSGAINAINSNFFGVAAGQDATDASESNFIGESAGQEATAAISANFIGYHAGYQAAGAEYSNFIGHQAGYQALGAYNSNLFGYQAGYQAETAGNSNFIGSYAGNLATNASDSNFIGTQAGEAATNANNSIFIGFLAGSNATDANSSIFLGVNAGVNDNVNNTGNADDFSILIGPNTSTGNDGLGVGFSNSIALGAYATNTASNQFMIGSATRPIDEIRVVQTGGTECIIDTSGLGCTSDERLKTNITDLATDTLSKLLNIKTVTYHWLNNPESKTMVGFIAQDLEQYFPELVATNERGQKSVYYAQMTPILVESIREMNLRITTLNEVDKPNVWRDSLVAWFANAANGIHEFVAGTIRARNQICIEDVCMTKDQLRALLQSTGTIVQPSPDPVTDTPAPQEDQVLPDEPSITPVPESDTSDSGNTNQPSPSPEVPQDSPTSE